MDSLLPSDTTDAAARVRTNHIAAMRAYRRFVPGLGHDGCGLFGTLTDDSLRRIMGKLSLQDAYVVDIGAADGKILLAALSHGARSAHGVDVAGDCLETKYAAIVAELKCMTPPAIESHQSTALRCKIDIRNSEARSIEAFLALVFPLCAQYTATSAAAPNLVVVSNWHGFAVDAKQRLMKYVARSNRTAKFCVVGPRRQPYGTADEIVAYLEDYGWVDVQRAPRDDLVVALSGSGEKHHAVIIG